MPTTYAIPNGATQFAATTYTGNGSTQTITNGGNNPTGVTFQPDFVWYKNRSIVASHNLFDSVRGVNQYLISDSTSAEGTASGVTAFNSNGFSLGSLSNGNGSGNSLVAWQWKANGAAVSNTAGSITTQVSANTTAGFSIVSYTGVPVNSSPSTFGHGLGVAPKFLVFKNRDVVDDWYCYHASLGNTTRISLDTTGAAVGGYGGWNSTSPTSTVFTVTNNAFTTGTGQRMIAYCWAEVAGFSKFGSYTGNGSADGPFVYCGFRPRFIMFKDASGSWDWVIFDTSRYTYNGMNNALRPNTSGAEDSSWTNALDVLSNGFKLRNTYGSLNTNGDTIIFAAFAEVPTKFANAR